VKRQFFRATTLPAGARSHRKDLFATGRAGGHFGIPGSVDDVGKARAAAR
jgi:hypothetical protein